LILGQRLPTVLLSLRGSTLGFLLLMQEMAHPFGPNNLATKAPEDLYSSAILSSVEINLDYYKPCGFAMAGQVGRDALVDLSLRSAQTGHTSMFHHGMVTFMPSRQITGNIVWKVHTGGGFSMPGVNLPGKGDPGGVICAPAVADGRVYARQHVVSVTVGML
jgi:hypothetical protein